MGTIRMLRRWRPVFKVYTTLSTSAGAPIACNLCPAISLHLLGHCIRAGLCESRSYAYHSVPCIAGFAVSALGY